MTYESQMSRRGGDDLEVDAGTRPFDISATAWLVGQSVRYLNTADKEGELAYQRTVELLRRNSEDLLETVTALFRQATSGDAPLRWSLLHVLADAGEAGAADFLVRTAVKELPDAAEEQGCEGTRDAEMLVCTMAVHALQRIAQRHPDASEQLLKVVSEKPARPILIEAVKAANELGLKGRARAVLQNEDHWILDIRQARTEELFAEPEREDGKERGFTPPGAGGQYTAPQIARPTRMAE